MKVQPFTFYLQPDITFKIVTTRWGTFSILAGFIYSFHLVMTIIGVDKYTDITRLNLCGNAKTGEEASEIYDSAIMLATIFHMIEWIRWTVFITTTMVNVNLVNVFYILSMNIPFGFIVMLLAVISKFSSSEDC